MFHIIYLKFENYTNYSLWLYLNQIKNNFFRMNLFIQLFDIIHINNKNKHFPFLTQYHKYMCKSRKLVNFEFLIFFIQNLKQNHFFNIIP